MKAIFWFRNDLRLEDNQALAKCLAANEEVLPVYIFDPRHFEELAIGIKKTGYFRTKFLMESLEDLRSSLQSIGSNLLIKNGNPEEVIAQLAKQFNATNVYATKEVTPEEVAVEKALEQALWNQQKKLVLTWQSTLYHEEDIPWPIHRLPQIFTEFRKQAEREASVRPAIAAPSMMPKVEIEGDELPTIEELGLSAIAADPRSAYPFQGGETKAKKRLEHYLFDTDLVAQYKNTRNQLLGTEYSTKFSAWLSLGCISPRVIYEAVKRYERERKKNQSTYWVVFELMWRDYFRFVAKKFGNKLFLKGGIKETDPQLGDDMSLFRQWTKGKTGQPFIDANMIELNKTGFMSNRGRQNVASYLVNDLKVNWTWGASYFESQLVDYDPCTNWGNWCYVAGVGNDPRKDRYFNPEAQSERYDPQQKFVKKWLNEDEVGVN